MYLNVSPARRLRGALVFLGLCFGAQSLAAQTIDTRWNTRGLVSGGTGVFAQSFTVDPEYSVLNDFSVFVNGHVGGPVNFRTYLFAFDGTYATGPALFTSAVQSATNSAPPAQMFTFATTGLSLTPGGLFLAVMQNVDDGGLIVGYAQPSGGSYGDNYAGGQFYGGSSRDNPAGSTYTPIQFAPGNDLEFVAHFSAADVTVTPEPASFVLLATGLLGILAVRYRARRGASAS